MSSIISRALAPLALTGLALVIASAAASCRKSDHYCPGAPLDNCNYLDAVMACSGNADCSEPTAVCDLGGSNACVQCLAPDQTAACAGGTPVCGDDHACRACRAHAECPASGTCLPDGACADPAQVAYVRAGGTGPQPCTKAAPCGTLQEGVAAVGASRPFVKIAAGTLAAAATTTIDAKAVTILAEPGAKLDRTGDGVILEVRNTGADVRIYDLEITGASGAAGDVGLSMPAGGMPKLTLTRVKVTNNQGGGIAATGGVLTVSQSTISGNPGGGIAATGGVLTVSQSTISGNSGGGVSVTNAQFDIANTLIAKNGGPSASYGGVVLSQTNTGTRRFEFNTIAQNQATGGITPGVLCLAIGTALMLTNSIVYDNGAGLQVEGSNCTWTYSDIGPNTVAGTGNINMNPMFKDPAQNDFHLQPGSPAKDAADPAASLAIDIDGDPRPRGAARDIGADEAP